MRLIDADALKKDVARLHALNDEAKIRKAYTLNPHSTMTDFEETLVSVFDAIDDTPTIDAVSVVRCAECRKVREDGGHANCYGYLYCTQKKSLVNEDDYCSWGKNK